MNLDDLDIADLRRRRGEKWSSFPDDVLPAWVAEMDFPPCPPVTEMLERSVALGDVGYPKESEIPRLCEAFSRRAAERFGWMVDPARVEPLADVVQGIYLALHAYCDPGDGAIVQTPIYPPFLSAVPESARRLVLNPLLLTGAAYQIDLDALRAQIDAGTRLLLFCNPQNPTGRAFSRAELEGLAEVVLEHDLVVCSDEIHADLVYPGNRHIPFATLSPEIAARTLTLTSATKAFNIAGLRCAVAVFGSEALQRRFNALPPHLRGGLGILGLEATRLAWTEGQPWLDTVMAYLEGNRRMVRDFVDQQLEGLSCHAPQATYLAWIDCRARALELDPFRFFLERARVALSDGRAFGADGAGFVRLNFATSRPILRAILDRLAEALAA